MFEYSYPGGVRDRSSHFFLLLFVLSRLLVDVVFCVPVRCVRVWEFFTFWCCVCCVCVCVCIFASWCGVWRVVFVFVCVVCVVFVCKQFCFLVFCVLCSCVSSFAFWCCACVCVVFVCEHFCFLLLYVCVVLRCVFVLACE